MEKLSLVAERLGGLRQTPPPSRKAKPPFTAIPADRYRALILRKASQAVEFGQKYAPADLISALYYLQPLFDGSVTAERMAEWDRGVDATARFENKLRLATAMHCGYERLSEPRSGGSHGSRGAAAGADRSGDERQLSLVGRVQTARDRGEDRARGGRGGLVGGPHAAGRAPAVGALSRGDRSSPLRSVDLVLARSEECRGGGTLRSSQEIVRRRAAGPGREQGHGGVIGRVGGAG